MNVSIHTVGSSAVPVKGLCWSLLSIGMNSFKGMNINTAKVL
jgi:hypothetical protein